MYAILFYRCDLCIYGDSRGQRYTFWPGDLSISGILSVELVLALTVRLL